MDGELTSAAGRVADSDINPERRAGSRRALAAGVVAAWLVLSLITASQRYADSLQTSSPAGFSQFFFWSLALWSYWALLAPLIFRLAEKPIKATIERVSALAEAA